VLPRLILCSTQTQQQVISTPVRLTDKAMRWNRPCQMRAPLTPSCAGAAHAGTVALAESGCSPAQS
jgi:hypothetical protein